MIIRNINGELVIIKRSNYIEKLIREDMEKRGKNINREF